MRLHLMSNVSMKCYPCELINFLVPFCFPILNSILINSATTRIIRKDLHEHVVTNNMKTAVAKIYLIHLKSNKFMDC